jgi:diguanylate cyclase (GGDEF)-like protein
MMIERLRKIFYPRIEFEERVYRTRLARLILILHFFVLAFWLLGTMWIEFVSQRATVLPLGANVIAVVLGYLVGLAALLLLRSNRTLLAGYALALVPLLLGTTNLFFAPNTIPLSSVSMVVSVVIAGAVVGGGAGFAFAGFSVGVVVARAILGMVFEVGTMANTTSDVSFVHIFSIPVATITSAIIMDGLSRQVQRSIDRLHGQAERLGTLANTDALTQLANRRFLLEQLQREFERARRYRRPLSMLYLDLDGFKGVNDRFGHMFGDEVLHGAARSMSAVLRSTDFLARIGGDEFAVLMPETTISDSAVVIDKLRRALAAYSDQLQPNLPRLTFSAGVAQMSEDDETIEAMLGRADSAMYVAKSDGKNSSSSLGQPKDGEQG